MQLVHELSDEVEHGASRCSEVIKSARSQSVAVDFAREPAVALHALEQRIQRAGTDVIAMAAKLSEDPLADNRPFGRVMEDVDLP